jgi:hypothetical protein
MDFRRSGQLDERRRRVLMDEIASPADADSSPANGSAKGPVRAYHAAVLSERQPRVTDLLPVRPLWVVVLLLLGLTGIATIEAIHVHAVTLPLAAGASHLAALDASQRGSLAAWYSSALLAAAAALAVVIFGIRAHRVDDYRGHYRVWLWTAATLAWLSLDAATDLHDALGLSLTLLAGKQVFSGPLAAGCTMTWIIVYGLVLGGLGLRLAVEIWSSLLSFASLLTAAVLYLCAALLQLEMLAAPASLIGGVIESTVAMLAHLSLFSSIAFYARHVYLDATGRLKVQVDGDRKAKAKSRAKLKVVKAEVGQVSPAAKFSAAAHQPDAPARQNAGTDAPARPTAAKPGVAITKSTLSAHDDEDEDEDENYGSDNLSKSERRRLKKISRRDQQRRAA